MFCWLRVLRVPGSLFFIKYLEDLGYETIDNLPLKLVEAAVFEDREHAIPLAINIDTRSRHFSPQGVITLVERLRSQGVSCQLIFLESDPKILQLRYSETRRAHPLDKGASLKDSLAEERELMGPLKEAADFSLDSSLLTPPELKALVRRRFMFRNHRDLFVDVISFAFRRGVPSDANMVLDMRFLKNPYYDPMLQPLTGEDSSVQSYLEHNPLFGRFLGQVTDLLETILPEVRKEGRAHFVVALGCSGGQHRSVAAAQALFYWLQKNSYQAHLTHRELEI